MKKIVIALGVLILLAALVVGAFFSISVLRPKVSGLVIDSNPSAAVFVNGIEMGTTPFRNKKLVPGEYSIRLQPQDKSLAVFDTKINLAPNIETVLKRNFSDTEEYSSTEMISFEPGKKDEASLSVVTIPTNSELVIDDQIRGFTPYNVSNIASKDHKMTINLMGYMKKEINFKTHPGYKLIIYAVLAKDKAFAISPSPTPSPSWFIEISDTPTGFLRVRKEPSTVGAEVGQVKPGEKFKLLEENQDTGWFKIEYKPGIPGWISNQFAKKVLENDGSIESSSQTNSTPSARLN